MGWLITGANGQQTDWHLPTQDAVALRFAEAWAGRLRYCHDAQAWFLFDGTVWRRDRTGEVASLVRTSARTMAADPFGKPGATAGQPRFVAGVERFARDDPALAVTAEAWDGDPWRLGTPAGPVDLRTGLLGPADPAHGLRVTTGVAPADLADCPLWRRFLEETFDGDAGTVGFLRRFLGYALTGSVAEQAMVFCWGPGGTGKTLFLNAVLHAMGGHARPAALATLTGREERHEADLAALAGARLIALAEGDAAGWSERRIKLMTGGDPLVGRLGAALAGAKLLVMGNGPPGLGAIDEAARRRLRIVPFRHRPARPERDLEARLRAEAPGILRWMIEGCLDWQADGLGLPERVAEATADHLDDQDALGRFLDARCARAEGATETSAALFAAWRDWAEADGAQAGSHHAFAVALARRGFTRDRTASARVWKGVSLGTPAVETGALGLGRVRPGRDPSAASGVTDDTA